MALFWILFVVSAAMVAVHLVVVAGALNSLAREPRSSGGSRSCGGPRTVHPERRSSPSVTVLVPARNEETLLPRLLRSLEAQDTDGFEVVLVNDRSSDATGAIMERFAARLGERVRIVTLTDEPPPGNPKQRALAAGAAVAGGEVILMTDADCRVRPAWVRTMTEAFRDDRVGLVFASVVPGTTGLDRRTGFLDRFQRFDQVFRFQYTAAAAGLGAPSGGFGNNLAVRAAALSDAGGFGGLRYSLTEDAQLICQVRETGRWLIRALRCPSVHVEPAAETGLRELLRQSVRWNSGGLFAPDPVTRASYRLVMFYLFVSVLLLPAASWQPALALPAAASFTSMLLLAVLAGALNRQGGAYWLLVPVNLVFAMLFYSYVTLLTLLRVPVSWKGRRLPA